MVDKIVEILQNMQKDIGELHGDVKKLSDKVDNLQGQELNFAKAQPLESVDNNINYGRKLSDSEQAYIEKLHGGSAVKESAMDSGESVMTMDSTTAPEAPAPTAPPHQYEPSVIENFFVWLAKDWPMKVGGFFVIAAVGWFVTWASKVGLLSEVTRVILGYIFAVGCVAFGAIRADKNHTQGNIFLVIGIGAMFISTLAGINYDIITHIVGLFVLLAAVGFVTLISLKQNSVSLTSSMIFFGAIIPLFFPSVGINTIFVYLFILTLGTLWIVSFTAWRGLTAMMLAVVAFYSIGYILNAYGSEVESLKNIIIAFLFAATFYIANVSAIIKSEKPQKYDLITAIGTGLLFLTWILNFSPEEFEVFLLLVGVLFFAFASYAIFIRTNHKAPTAIYGGVSAMLFAVATALQFDGPVLVTAYLVEAAAVVLITLYFARNTVTQGTRVLLTLIYSMPVIMSLGYIAKIFDFLSYGRTYTGRYSETVMDMMSPLFVVLAGCITAFSVAIGAVRMMDISNKENMTFFRIFAYTGAVYTLLLIWFVTHLFMSNEDLATFTSLVIYTVSGVVFYIMGVQEEYKAYKVVGGLLFGIVVLRVLFVEFWEMDIVMRFITSFVLGALLISTAFIKSNKK